MLPVINWGRGGVGQETYAICLADLYIGCQTFGNQGSAKAVWMSFVVTHKGLGTGAEIGELMLKPGGGVHKRGGGGP